MKQIETMDRILELLADGKQRTEKELIKELDAPENIVMGSLKTLQSFDRIAKTGDRWRLKR